MTYPTAVQMTPARLLINGVDCSGQNSSGVQLVFSTIAGWFGGASVRTSFSDRPNTHGQFDAPVFRGSRSVTVTGWAYADTRSAVALALQAFVGNMGDGSLGTLELDDPDYGDLTCQARLSDTPQIVWDTYALSWKWQLQFTAPDPLLYGPASTSAPVGLPGPAPAGLAFPLFGSTGKLEFGSSGSSSGQFTLLNLGNAASWPIFTIVGAVIGGFSLTEQASGRQIIYLDDVPAGSTLIIDSADGTAQLNGVDRRSSISTAQWWQVPKQTSSTVQWATSGPSGQSGTCQGNAHSAYW